MRGIRQPRARLPVAEDAFMGVPLFRCAIMVALIVAPGCSSGGAVPAPAVQNTSAVPVSVAATLTTAGPTIVTLPPVNGYSATITLGALFSAQPQPALNVSAGSTLPFDAVAITTQTYGSSVAPLLYLSISTSVATAFNGITSVAISLPNGALPMPVYSLAAVLGTTFVAVGSPGPWVTWAGPTAAVNSSVTFSSTIITQLAYPAQPILFALYAGNPPS